MNPWEQNPSFDPGTWSSSGPLNSVAPPVQQQRPWSDLPEDQRLQNQWNAAVETGQGRQFDASHPLDDQTFQLMADLAMMAPVAGMGYRGLRGLGEEGALRVFKTPGGLLHKLEYYENAANPATKGVASVSWQGPDQPRLDWVNAAGGKAGGDLFYGLKRELGPVAFNNLEGSPLSQAIPAYEALIKRGRLDDAPDLKRRLENMAHNRRQWDPEGIPKNTYRNPEANNPLKGGSTDLPGEDDYLVQMMLEEERLAAARSLGIDSINPWVRNAQGEWVPPPPRPTPQLEHPIWDYLARTFSGPSGVEEKQRMVNWMREPRTGLDYQGPLDYGRDMAQGVQRGLWTEREAAGIIQQMLDQYKLSRMRQGAQ